MKKVGELLRKEREKRGLTLQEIGMALKINPKMLASIEEGDLDSLPARTFLRGFVRSYAQYLRIDIDLILKLFNEETAPAVVPINLDAPAANPVQPAEPKTTAAPSIGPSFDIKKYIYPIVSIVVLSVLIIIAAVTLEKYQKETQVKPYTTGHPIQENVAKAESGAENTESTSTTVVMGESETSAKGTSETETTTTSSTMALSSAKGVLFLATTTTTLAPQTSTTQKVSETTTTTTQKSKPTTTTMPPTTTLKTTTTTTTTQKPKPTTTTIPPTTTLKATTTTTTTQKPKPTTTTLPPTTTLKTTTTTLATDSAATGSTTSTTLKINQNEIILEAYDKVTVKFSSDEKTWQQVDLNADQVHTLKSKGLIYLDISNGGAINLIVNGKERGVPGKIGESFKTKVP